MSTRQASRSEGFTAEEKAAMKERAAETRSAKRTADATAAVLAKIAEMQEADRVVAERIHAIIGEAAPTLVPRLWYGMPAYAAPGQVVCFFQSAAKSMTRYPTLGFSAKAALDDGAMWQTAYAVTALTPGVEKQIAELVARAAGTGVA